MTSNGRLGQTLGGDATPWPGSVDQRGTRYYTRSKKIGGGVVREYMGGGVLGALPAKMDAAGRPSCVGVE